MTSSDDSGVLLQQGEGTWWAWVAVHLAPARMLADTRAYADTDLQRRLREAAAAERAWLAALGPASREVLAGSAGVVGSSVHSGIPGEAAVGNARLELRYSTIPEEKLLRCTLFGRVQAPEREQARAAALRWREQLARVPAHVDAEPIDDVGEIQRRLQPGQLHPDGCSELRKPLQWGWFARTDTPRQVGVAIVPLAAEAGADVPTLPRSWEPVWHMLARLRTPAMLSIGLEPYALCPQLLAGLRGLNGEYRRLASAGSVSPVWTVAVPPDPFAVLAAPSYTESLRRYASGAPTFRMRISVAATAPVDRSFAELVASTIGQARVLTVDSGELAGMWQNLAALNQDWLACYAQGAPVVGIGRVERALSDLVDEAEAASAVRLPLEIQGHHELFSRDSGMPQKSRVDSSARNSGAVGPSPDPGAPSFDART